MFNFLIHQVSVERDTLAREIAERSAAATLLRLRADAEKMSAAELRGYVRAHALPFVRAEAANLADCELSRTQFERSIAMALEQTTHLVVRQLKAHPVVAIPAPHVRLRLAA